MSKENFAEKMKIAKEAKKAKEAINFKAGDVIETDKGESIELDAQNAASLNEQIEEGYEENEAPTQITSTEIQVTSSEFHNFGIILFEKNKPTFLTDKVLDKLLEMPNFKDLIDRGVIKIGV